MTRIARVAGIDPGKRHLDVATFPATDEARFENTPEGVAQLAAWLRAHGVDVVGIEASGGVERRARDALIAAGIAVRVFDPRRVRHFAKAKGLRAKSDRIDAAVVAEFTAAFPDAACATPDPGREELAGLIRARRLVVAKRADLTRGLATVPAAARAPWRRPSPSSRPPRRRSRPPSRSGSRPTRSGGPSPSPWPARPGSGR